MKNIQITINTLNNQSDGYTSIHTGLTANYMSHFQHKFFTLIYFTLQLITVFYVLKVTEEKMNNSCSGAMSC